MTESEKSKYALRVSGIAEKECVVCGKTFIPAPEHIYKRKTEYMCSYTCYRKGKGKRNGKNG